MNYLHWDEKTITDFSEKNISDMYARGYVFTRIGKGVMHQTRSVRVDLSKFELSSENRRILNKTKEIELKKINVPLNSYDWRIGKMAKDFYEQKFGPGIMSAQKVKEMLTDAISSSFNLLLPYDLHGSEDNSPFPIGYAICYWSNDILHYSYPFYQLGPEPKDIGLGMMIRAIQFAKQEGLQYAYLGSLQRPGDTYKLQFEGLEWFDGGPNGTGKWQTDLEAVKEILKK